MYVQQGSVMWAVFVRELHEGVQYRRWISRSITVERLDQLMECVKELNRLYEGGAAPLFRGTFLRGGVVYIMYIDEGAKD